LAREFLFLAGRQEEKSSCQKKNLVAHSKNKTPVLGNAAPVLGMKPKRGWYVFWLFFKIGLCSSTSMESSRRDLSNDVAEHGPILKNNQNTYHSRFGFTPKTGI